MRLRSSSSFPAYSSHPATLLADLMENFQCLPEGLEETCKNGSHVPAALHLSMVVRLKPGTCRSPLQALPRGSLP